MEGKRDIGGDALVICSCEAAGVNAAAAVAYCRFRRGVLLHRRMEAIAFDGVCIRGRILWVSISLNDLQYRLCDTIGCTYL